MQSSLVNRYATGKFEYREQEQAWTKNENPRKHGQEQSNGVISMPLHSEGVETNKPAFSSLSRRIFLTSLELVKPKAERSMLNLQRLYNLIRQAGLCRKCLKPFGKADDMRYDINGQAMFNDRYKARPVWVQIDRDTYGLWLGLDSNGLPLFGRRVIESVEVVKTRKRLKAGKAQTRTVFVERFVDEKGDPLITPEFIYTLHGCTCK